MPLPALPMPHAVSARLAQRTATVAATLPAGTTGFTLTLGTYEEAPFIGMTVKVTLSQPLVHLATGDVTQVSWTATVGADGTATLGPLPYNDDPAFWPGDTSYYAEWQALSWRPTPGNKAFQVLQSAGPTVDFDLIGAPGSIPTTTYAQVDSAVVGIAIVD